MSEFSSSLFFLNFLQINGNPVQGYPQAIPISFRISKANHVRHSWWHNLVLSSRFMKDLFQPASGCFIELYKNSLFGKHKILFFN